MSKPDLVYLLDAVLQEALDKRHAWIEKQIVRIHKHYDLEPGPESPLRERITVELRRDVVELPIAASVTVIVRLDDQPVATRRFEVKVTMEARTTWAPSIRTAESRSSSDTSSTS